MKKESALYRFVYTVTLLAATAAVAGSGVFGLHYALAGLAVAATANPPEIVVLGVLLALFAVLAALALLFAALFNPHAAAAGLRTRFGSRPSAYRPRFGWAWAAASFAAMVLFLRFGIPFTELFDAMELRTGIVFFFLPFLWEYVLGWTGRPAPARGQVSAKAAAGGF